MWYVYVIECADDSLYTGITCNVDRRFKEHHDKFVPSTKYRSPKRVIYTEQFSTLSEAHACERQIKGWTRFKKLALIKGNKALLKKL